jgi:hypothetical protein
VATLRGPIPPIGACIRNATTTDTAAATGTILALDLGKYKSVAYRYDRATAQARFPTLDTTRDELRRLLAQHPPALVVCEARALAGGVHDRCAGLHLPCKVANTVSEAWKFKHTKRKTDKPDHAARAGAVAQAAGRARPESDPQAVCGRRWDQFFELTP